MANTEGMSKKRTLDKHFRIVAETGPGATQEKFYNKLIAYKIGLTAIGKGIATLYCRVDCSKTFDSLFKLAKTNDVNATDGVSVRIVFVLIAAQNGAASRSHHCLYSQANLNLRQMLFETSSSRQKMT
ncbi:MAG: PTS sugar transporter subunit IIA [Candidatus Azotimanducaceae bacterium]